MSEATAKSPDEPERATARSEIAVRSGDGTAAVAPGTSVRRLLRSADRATLGTIDDTGAPYVSLVMLAVDHDAAPLLLLSDLADHTRNFGRDPRVSLLLDGTSGMASPLAGARATLMGRIERSTAPHQHARYLARHADAAGYAGFADFNFYAVRIERAHLVQGFGKIHWIEGSDVLWRSGPDLPLAGEEAPDLPLAAAEAPDLPLAAAEAEVVAHMNADHRDAVRLYATVLAGQPEGDWRLTGVDPEGADLAAGQKRCRLWFDKPVRDAEGARVELVRLVERARQATTDK